MKVLFIFALLVVYCSAKNDHQTIQALHRNILHLISSRLLSIPDCVAILEQGSKKRMNCCIYYTGESMSLCQAAIKLSNELNSLIYRVRLNPSPECRTFDDKILVTRASYFQSVLTEFFDLEEGYRWDHNALPESLRFYKKYQPNTEGVECQYCPDNDQGLLSIKQY